MPIKMVLKTCITALNNVVTCGESSCENLVNSIKNLKAVVEAIERQEKEAKDRDADDGQRQDG